MIGRFKSVVIRNKVVFENFSFLSILQVSNLLVFMLTIPYLFRVLGKENYGLVVFAQTIALYFSIIVNFGFNVTATRDVSLFRHDQDLLSNIISSILSLKLFFFIISIVILFLFSLFIPIIHNHPEIFYLSMLFCLSEALFPVWYFQGIEKMKYITFINLITRVSSAFLIFAFVRVAKDYLFVPLFLGIGSVSGAIAGLYIVFGIERNQFRVLSLPILLKCVKENVPLFISNVSSQIYVNANKLIVGSVLGMQEVALYDIADKIVTLVKVPIPLVGRTLFPKVSREKNITFIKKSMVFLLGFFIVIYLILFIFSNSIIHLFTGVNNPTTANLLRLLSFSILPICLSMFFAELILIPFKRLKDYAKMRTSSMLVYLIIVGLLFLYNKLGLFELAGTIVFVEIFVTLYSFYLCKKNSLI